MEIILFDQVNWRNQLKPLTLTRPIANLRIGIKTIAEKYQDIFNFSVSYLTEGYLNHKFDVKYGELNVYVNASFLPTISLVNSLKKLKPNEALMQGDELIALVSEEKFDFGFSLPSNVIKIQIQEQLDCLRILPDLFNKNAQQITSDFTFMTMGRVSRLIEDKFTAVYNINNIFVEEGVSIKASILNAENGPIYIGKNTVIQEGSLIIGPAAICENSMVAFGAKIRPNTTLGPVSRVGGEVGNSIFYGFSNKAHDGFLGNSYIGEWCNLGANTNNSNLKNDYKTVKLYNYDKDELDETNELFCGTFMGDFSKAGISTMFNTGTIVGVCANVFGAGFQDKFIPSFSWGGHAEGYQEYRFDKCMEVINATMARRNTSLTEEDLKILRYISDHKK